MTPNDLEEIAERLAAIRNIILDREGEDTADQFVVEPYILTINIEGSGYSEDEDVFTLIQIEQGPAGMEKLLACAVEEIGTEDPDSYVLCGEDENLLEILEDACDKAYRHWHWLDLPSALPGSEQMDDEDELLDDENF